MRRHVALSSAALLTIASCSSDANGFPPAAPPAAFPGAVGVERVLEFSHPSAAAHVGVDAIRLPHFDAAVGELRDDELLISAAGTGIHATRVDDRWNKLAEAYWPVPGQSVPWSDVKIARLRDPFGREGVFVYHVSRGSDQLQITDVTDFPTVTTVHVPIDIGLPIAVRGAHTLQVHEGRAVLVLNGVDLGAGTDPMPAPLTPGCAPAAFYDLGEPMAPRLLSLFVGSEPGTQILFDSQFLRIDGSDVWAPTIDLPTLGVSSFEFYEFTDPADMQHARKLGDYRGATSGQAHNVVQLPDREGSPLLAAGFEAWAFTSTPGQVIAKAAVIDVRDLTRGTAPQFVAWLVSDENLRDAVHNPCSRLAEVGTHTWDTVPLAHFTGGYYLYEYGASTARPIAHVPVSRVAPSGRFGVRHETMSAPVWMAAYNGAWDMVATQIGDFVSCTDREASYLIEPTYGFARQFGSYLAQADGTVPRVQLAGPVPEAGRELRVRCTGLQAGGRVALTIATRLAAAPILDPNAGALWFDPASVITVLTADANGDTLEFVVPNPAGSGGQLVLTAVEHGASTPSGALKSPAAVFRVRATPR